MKKTVFLTSFLLVCFAILLQVPSNESLAEEKQLQPDDEKTLRLVLVPEKNIFEQRRRYKYITDYLSKKMDMNFIVEIMANYGDISEAFIEGKADAGFFG
jgi:ABC-type phosphate/phosphonate transport system substrate-binding protein